MSFVKVVMDRGFQKAALNMKILNPATRARVREAISETTVAIAAHARQLVPVSTEASRKAAGRPGPGELRDTIRESMSATGLVGYVHAGYGDVKRRSRRRSTRAPSQNVPRLATFERRQRRAALAAQSEMGIYAMVVEYGNPHRGVPARPFLRPAFEKERAAHIDRIRKALEGAIQEVARRAA